MNRKPKIDREKQLRLEVSNGKQKYTERVTLIYYFNVLQAQCRDNNMLLTPEATIVA